MTDSAETIATKVLVGRYEAARRALAEERLLSERSQVARLVRRQRLARAEDAAVEARRALADQWEKEDGVASLLERRFREIDFRADVRALFAVGGAAPGSEDYRRAVEREEELRAALRDYWLGSGHDVAELDAVFSAAEYDVADVIPK